MKYVKINANSKEYDYYDFLEKNERIHWTFSTKSKIETGDIILLYSNIEKEIRFILYANFIVNKTIQNPNIIVDLISEKEKKNYKRVDSIDWLKKRNSLYDFKLLKLVDDKLSIDDFGIIPSQSSTKFIIKSEEPEIFRKIDTYFNSDSKFWNTYWNNIFQEKIRKNNDDNSLNKISYTEQAEFKKRYLKSREIYIRNSKLIIKAKKEIKHMCFGCEGKYDLMKRTFLTDQNIFYLEIHHIISFSSDVESDVMENLTKLCPICHQALISANLKTKREIISNILHNSTKELNIFINKNI